MALLAPDQNLDSLLWTHFISSEIKPFIIFDSLNDIKVHLDVSRFSVTKIQQPFHTDHVSVHSIDYQPRKLCFCILSNSTRQRPPKSVCMIDFPISDDQSRVCIAKVDSREAELEIPFSIGEAGLKFRSEVHISHSILGR